MKHFLKLTLLILLENLIDTLSMPCYISAITGFDSVFSNTGQFNILFTPVTSLPTGSLAYLTISSKWSSDSTRSILQSNSACAVKENDNSNIGSCTGPVTVDTLSTFTCALPIASSPSSKSFSITCTNIQNPTSTAGSGTFKIDTSTNGLAISDTCFNLNINNFIANAIKTASFNIKDDNSLNVKINKQGLGEVQFTTVSPLYSGDTINLLFDSQVSFSSSPTVSILIGGNPSLFTLTSHDNNALTLTMNILRPAGSLFWISIYTMISGPSIKASLISIQTKRGTYFIDNLYLPVSFSPIAGTLTLSPSIGILDTTIFQATQYSFTFTPTDGLSISAYILITLPDSITVSSTIQCVMLVGSAIPKPATCIQKSSSPIVIKVYDLFLTSIMSQQLILQVTGIINPKDSDAIITFSSFDTYYDLNTLPYLVNSLQTPVQLSGFSAGQFLGTTITALNQVVGDQSALQLQIIIGSYIAANSYLIIQIPSGISFTQNIASCTVGGVSTPCQISYPTTRSAQISQIFSTDLTRSTNIILILSNFIVNPPSTKLIGSFTLTSYKSNLAIQDTLNNIVGLQITDPSTFRSASLSSRSSLVNGNIATYQFTFSLKTLTPTGSTLQINFRELTVSSNTACSSSSAQLLDSLVCIVNAGVVTITLDCKSGLCTNSQIPTSTPLQISVSGIMNPKSFVPSSALGLATFTYDNYKISQYTGSDIYVQNTKLAPLISAFLSTKNGIYGEPDNYQFAITTNNAVDSNCVIQIVVPLEITIPSSINCATGYSGLNSAPLCTVSGNTISVSQLTSTSVPTFTISQLVSPIRSSMSSFIVITYQIVNSVQYPMETITTGLIFTAQCTLPCRTCSSNDVTNCLSCYTKSSISNNLYLTNVTPWCVSSCGDYYYQNTALNTCQQCPDRCKSCDITLTCTICDTAYLLSSGTCVSQCSDGKYLSVSTCLNCSSSCLTCISDQNICTSCGVNLINYQRQCLSQCPSDVYLLEGKCVGCTSPCLTCETSPHQCTSCLPNSGSPFLSGATCVNLCSDGYYGDIVSQKCLTCVAPCNYCISATSCLNCVDSYYLATQCLSQCPSFYFIDGLECSACISPCETCTTSTICVTCRSTFYQLGQQCFSQCPDGYYQNVDDQLGQICTACPSSCILCTSSTVCQSCLSTSLLPYLLISTCVASCPSAYYQDGQQGKCIKCLYPCNLCTSSSDCLSCSQNSATISNFLLNQRCLTNCPSLYYPDAGNCLKCVSPCDTCESATSCLTCIQNTAVQYYFLTKQCITSCPATYYIDAANCSKCVSPCGNCTSASICTTCINTNYKFLSGQCFSICPIRYFPSLGNCSSCVSPCDQCDSLNSCITCSVADQTTKLYLLNSQCINNCPQFYYNDTSICQKCISPCSTCQSDTSCLSCSSSATYYLLSDKCLTQCPSLYYPNGQICSNCEAPCETCESATSCLTCTGTGTGTAHLLLNKDCLTQCPQFYYNDTSICQKCISPCSTCESDTSCLSCVNGYQFLNKQCITQCPQFYYTDQGSCFKCIEPCENCESPIFCLSCASSMSLFLNNECLSLCPTNFYPDQGACISCVGPCETCTSPSACITCVSTSTYYKLNSQCLKQCPLLYYTDANTCQKCVAPCDTCESVSACITCQVPYQFLKKQCITKCPDQYYGDAGQCLSCSEPCLNCTSKTICLSCTSSLFQFYNQQCNNLCPSGLYPDNGSCSKCVVPCETCNTKTQCISCALSTDFLLNQQCINSCPSLYYANGQKCLACVAPCNTCESQTSCLTCIQSQATPYSFINNQCLKQCPLTYYSNAGFCLKCVAPCETCQSNSLCLSCSLTDNFFLLNNQCLPSCPTLFYPNADQCSPCELPCDKCESKTSCLSCAQTEASPFLFLNKQCYTQCPPLYYPDGGRCNPCETPCNTCESRFACLSCVTGADTDPYYFLDQKCVNSSCPKFYYSDANDCKMCVAPCEECYSSTACLTCSKLSNGLTSYLLDKQCLSECPPLYYSNGLICSNCDAGCLTCSAIECSSCDPASVTPYLQVSICVQTCSNTYYEEQGQCVICVFPCNTCLSEIKCISCQNKLIIFETQCIEVCPDGYFTENEQCTPCKSGCMKCSSKQCDMCSTPTLVFGNECIKQCPEGYVADKDAKTCLLISTISDLLNNLHENKYIPVPFLILLVVLGVCVIVSKMHKHETFVPGSLLGMVGLIEWLSWVTVLALFEGDKQYLAPLILGFLLNYGLNIINIIYFRDRIFQDPMFQRWYESCIPNKMATIIICILSLTCSFKASRLVYSRLFGFKFFSATLTGTENLTPFNVINGLSVILCSLPAVISSVLVAYKHQWRDQLFVSSIDAFCVTILTVIFVIWETQKDASFFEEDSNGQFYAVNQSKVEVQQESGFFDHTLNKLIVVQAANDQSLLVKDRDDIDDANQGVKVQDKIDEDNSKIAVKSIVKNTIYFGNPSYKQQSPLQNKSENFSEKVQSKDFMKRNPSVISYTKVAPQIKESQYEVDPDDEPEQPLNLANLNEEPPSPMNNVLSPINPVNTQQKGKIQIDFTGSQKKQQNNNPVRIIPLLPIDIAINNDDSINEHDESKLSIFMEHESNIMFEQNKLDERRQSDASEQSIQTVKKADKIPQQPDEPCDNSKRIVQIQNLELKIEDLDLQESIAAPQYTNKFSKRQQAQSQGEEKIKKNRSKVKSPPKDKQKTNRLSPDKRQPQQSNKKQEEFFDSHESVHTMSDAEWGENQISPSEFNQLNQRFDEHRLPQAQQAQRGPYSSQQSPRKQGLVSTSKGSRAFTGRDAVQKIKIKIQQNQMGPVTLKPDKQSAGDIENPQSLFEELERNRQNFDENAIRQMDSTKMKDTAKIYLQRIENNRIKNPKKKVINKSKDISESLFVDEDFDDSQIIF